MTKFKLHSKFKPEGSQPEAIKKLVAGISSGMKQQTLLGVTGSGKSLDYEEKIFIQNDEGIKHVKIGDFVEKNLTKTKKKNDTIYQNVLGYKCISFDPKTYAISSKDIVQISKHKENQLFEIILDDNSKIKVTKYHNCYRLANVQLELVQTKELNVGDFLPISNTIPQPERRYSYFSILEYANHYKINVKDLISNFDRNNTKTLSVLKKYYRAPKWKLSQILKQTKERGISAGEMHELVEKLGLTLKKANSHITIITKGKAKIHPLIAIDKSFLTFLGLYLAEGHNTKKCVLISNQDKKLQQICKRFYSQHGCNYYVRNKNDVAYHSVIFSIFFLTFGSTAHSKRIADFIYNLSNEQLAIVLQAYFDGDGWVEKNSVNVISASEDLIYGVKNLLLRFGITARIKIKKVKYRDRTRSYQKLSISGVENIRKFQKTISFSIINKRKKLFSINLEKSNTNVDLIPNSGQFFRKIRHEYGLSQKDVAKICDCNRSHISMIESEQRHPSKVLFHGLAKFLILKDKKYDYLRNILDFNFRKIVKIRKVKPKNSFVYDVAIKDNETFMAGDGNIFVHNTFTMANVIEKIGRPTIVIAHNKTLAAQLYNEFKEFFPENRVEYFVSYYDYYQPESYIPSKDQYIEKDSAINAKLDQLRLSATASILARPDTIVVASVSCIYNVGNPESYRNMGFEISKKTKISRNDLLMKIIDSQYERNDIELMPGRFRVKGDTIDIIPSYQNNIIRIEMFGDEIEAIKEIDKVTGDKKDDFEYVHLYPAKHFVISSDAIQSGINSIREELEETLPTLEMIESHRLKVRTNHDIEMIQETGFCKGIENYSRHFDGRKSGEKPYCLLDYFPKDFLIIIDESHQTIPQIHGMFNGDHARKKTLIDYGFRLPSAFDNRPLKYAEIEEYIKKNKTIFVSATPSVYETEMSGQIVEQIIRPTGLIDPVVTVKPIKGQIDDLLATVSATIKKGNRVLVTTLTKKLAEELTEFLSKKGVKTRYLHSEIDTLERSEIIRELRLGKFDVLVGINLLREGLDIPEVGFIGILDADKEGFLRDAKSLIQIIGRAARNVDSTVTLYADKMTDSINKALAETARRREIQLEYNKKNKITPKTIIKPVKEKEVEIKDTKHIPKSEIPNMLIELEKEMNVAADKLDFERAIVIREKIRKLNERMGE